MTVELVTAKKIEILQVWDYDSSVAKVKVLVYKWKNVTQEIIDELRIARDNLSDSGRRTDLVANDTRLPTWQDYCKAIGIDRKTVHRWLALPHVSHNSGENEWYTPAPIIDAALLTMGSIDCDPASSDKANEIIKAKRYYNSETDGRKQKWEGNIWLNPPYAQPLVSEFCHLLFEKYISGEIKQACVLVNNATETAFYQEMLDICSAVCFIKGRVKFLDEDGIGLGAPLQGQTILYFGSNAQRFADSFSQFGVILYAK